jgi:outer membrane receptor protein involved in Fe transport
MAYARVATGFRPGGPKPAPGVTFELPQQNPDKTTDYEVGFKGSFFDRKLSYDLSLYHIKWEDIQMQLTAVNIINGVEVRGSYQGNASVAKSEGLDLSLEWRPISSMKFAGWIALNNAELTEDLPPEAVRGGSFGLAGDRLPFAARFSGSLSAGYDFPLADRVRGSTGISVTYIGDRKDILTSTAQRQDLDAFARADLRAGIEYRSWAGNVSVNNLTDRRGHISGGFGNIRPTDFYYIQPRTVALSVTKNFR